jgi:DNA helicase HerA-like ATPase
VYFVTQSPTDVPETVLGQLGNRVQHALRAFTPKDQRAVKTAADTFRPNPELDTARVITELAVGEALVSLLDERGTPAPVDRALVAPPRSRLGTITPEERANVIRMSPIAGRYDQVVERESAFEQLQGQAQGAVPQGASGSPAPQTETQPVAWPSAPSSGQAPQPGGWPTAPSGPAQPRPQATSSGRRPILQPGPQQPQEQGGIMGTLGSILGGGTTGGAAGGRQRQGLGETIVKSFGRNVAGTVGRTVATQILRGIFGSMRR